MFKRAKSKIEKPSLDTLSISDALKVQERLDVFSKKTSLTDEERKTLELASRLIGTLIVVYNMWGQSKKHLQRLLKNLFGKSSEKTKDLPKTKDRAIPPFDESQNQNSSEEKKKTNTPDRGSEKKNQECHGENKNDKSPRVGGGGKNSVDEYTSAHEIICQLEDHLKPGQLCPECKDNKLFGIDPKKVIRLAGQAPVTGFKFILEQSRCICGMIFTADVGDEFRDIYEAEKYGPSALASMIIHKYLLGVSFGSLEKVQGMSGVPLPASTQVNKIKTSALPVIQAVTKALKDLAANAYSLAFDDTTIRLLEKRETQKGGETTNGYGTAVIADGFDSEGNSIVLFDFDYTKHAGSVIVDLLKNRERNSLPVLASDGAPAYDESKKQGIDVNCNTHARRKVVEEDPKRATYMGCAVLSCYQEIYKNEKYCKEHGITDLERMKYHADFSTTHFEKIRTIFQIITGVNVLQEEKLRFEIPDFLCADEPNGDIYKVASYFLDRYDALTRVTKLPNIPLDTNHVERMIKLIIKLRKNSLFFNNTFSAQYSGEILSLLETADIAKINVFDYVEFLLKNKNDVLKNPKHYLPWLYKWQDEEKVLYWKKVEALMQSPANSSEFSTTESFRSSA